MRLDLVKKIAHGGMAEVYLAKESNRKNGKIWCIKRIIPTYKEVEEFRRMFSDEYEITKKFKHPNLIDIKEITKIEGQESIVMEYVPGVDIRDVLVKCEKSKLTIPIEFCCYIVSQLCQGLDYVHHLQDQDNNSLKIVHRDVSPQNILISFNGDVKVIDFGVADNTEKSNMTKPGVVKGKFSYMSPEQVLMKPIDLRTDVFAAGVILWEMLSMKKLFFCRSEIETLELVKTAKIREDICMLNPSVDQELRDIVHKALEKQLDKRYARCLDFEKAINGYLNKNYPDFTKADLAKFLREILPEKHSKIKQDIKEAIEYKSQRNSKKIRSGSNDSQSTIANIKDIEKHRQKRAKRKLKSSISSHPGKDIDFVEQEIKSHSLRRSQSDFESISNTNALRLSQAHSHINSSAHNVNSNFSSSGHKYSKLGSLSKKKTKLTSSKKVLIVLACIAFILMGAVAIKQVMSTLEMSAGSKTAINVDPMIILHATPNRVKISINNVSVGNEYIKTPHRLDLSKLNKGDNVITLSRVGFDDRNYNLFIEDDLQQQKDLDIVLRRADKMGSVYLKLVDIEEVDLKVNYKLEHNLESGKLTPENPVQITTLPVGRVYNIEISSSEGSFSCPIRLPKKTLFARYLVRYDSQSCKLTKNY